ncbi:RagB/SusD family nutrient uptake outer membrane protein [Christiangramia flava]|uniref:Uncharacterized protein n=1 Tax=Christiangramia flava JLT2011 TaxID=1229726 RepID=A0A1L7I205_9FLAO|nr:RagB/SusD family nutrient uptake outer membrane protein [Christiangramia flava]APU67639.1 hypothetical protein GRFL_0915 [Christiangramia flava JLT2011]OSS37679.1 SusD/RagB family protein [Christiangramia flava JLT2011]
MKNLYKKISIMILSGFLTISCEDYLEVDSPAYKIGRREVFDEDATAESAMKGIYNQLFTAAFSSGYENSVTVLAGLSSDNIQSLRENDLLLREFDQHSISPNNERNLALWSSTYQVIYMTNSLLQGLEDSQNLTPEIGDRLKGEALTVRAFTYFYLVNLYGPVPLILSTDYRDNSTASRNSVELVYDQVLSDLMVARDLLTDEYPNGDRTQINRNVANGLLARVHLFLGDWQEAEIYSTQVIESNSQYELSDDLNAVFLANSKEAIWQLTPEGRGGPIGYTNEGSIFIFLSFAPCFTKVSLTDDLVVTFSEADQRLQNWIGFNEQTEKYFPFKYKDRSSFNEIKEFSMVLRLAEQYLIRAQARNMLNNSLGALNDLNKIRERATVDLLSNEQSYSQEELSDLIFQERSKELFAEWGHRWLDLKREKRAESILGGVGNDWSAEDALYPIPAQERAKNVNLTQNPGY